MNRTAIIAQNPRIPKKKMAYYCAALIGAGFFAIAFVYLAPHFF